MLDSRRLRVLLEIARTGSLAAAAQRLGYTPSAVSQQVRALERELGTVVLERRGRGVALTEPGSALVAHARRIVDALGAAQAEVEAIAGLRAGVLRLGWFSTAGAILVPRAIARFRERHAPIELVLEEADPDESVQRLREGELDLAVVYEFRDDEPLPADLRLTPLLDDRLHIALPPPSTASPPGGGSGWPSWPTRRGSRACATAPPSRRCPPPAARPASSRTSPFRPTTRWPGRASSPPASASP